MEKYVLMHHEFLFLLTNSVDRLDKIHECHQKKLKSNKIKVGNQAEGFRAQTLYELTEKDF